jgi:hypothetical protein
LLYLVVDTSDKLTHDTKDEKLNPTDEQNKTDHRCPARYFGWVMAEELEIAYSPQ